MHDQLERIIKLQTLVAAIVLAIIGFGLMTLANQIGSTPNLAWLSFFPLNEVGGTLFVAAILGLGIDYFTNKDKDARDTARLKRVLADSAPAMRDAVIKGFAFGNEDLARVASPETLDDIIRNSLALRLGDGTFADEVYQDIRNQAVQAAERWHDAKVQIQLSPLLGIPSSTTGGRTAASVTGPISEQFFAVTVRWEYSVIPAHRSRHFAVASNRIEYAELRREEGMSAWYLTPNADVDPSSREAFEIVQFSVDGQDRPIRRSTRKTGQLYSVDLGADVMRSDTPVTIAYTFCTITEQHGHLLYIDVEQPTRDIEIELDYGDCDIERVSVLDFIASSRTTRIERTPTSVPGKTVRAAFDDWAFPRSGIGFVWVLGSEKTGATTADI